MWGTIYSDSANKRHDTFFLIIKSGNAELIQSTFSQLSRECKAIVHSAVELSWYMRGAIQYKDMLLLTPGEREIIRDFVSNHMETIKKHPYPVY